MAEREFLVQQRIRGILNQPGTGVRLWRNNVGSYQKGSSYIQYGLAPGSADLIGICSVIVEPEMVGMEIGQFLSIEIKTPTGRVDPKQLVWQETVRKLGGIAEIFRTAEEAEAFLKGDR